MCTQLRNICNMQHMKSTEMRVLMSRNKKGENHNGLKVTASVFHS